MKVIIFREKALYRKGVSPLSVEAKGGQRASATSQCIGQVQRPSAVGRRSGEDQRASAVDTLIGQAHPRRSLVKKLREIHLEHESPF